MKEFLSNLNLQDLWKDVQEQIVPWLETTSSKLLVFLAPLYQKALLNPLPTGALLLALIVIPLIFLKIKKPKPETEGRLDQLMEEMQGFEVKKPLIDLQKKFSNSPITNMEPLRHEKSSMQFDFESDPGFKNSDHLKETLDSDSLVELPSLFSNEEGGENDASRPYEEQETAAASTDSIENQFQLDDKELEFGDTTEEISDWSQISRPALSDYDDTELTIDGIERLQQQIEQSTLDLPSEQEKEGDVMQEIEVAPTSPVPEPIELIAQNEDIEKTVSTIEEEMQYQEDEPYLPATDPVVAESESSHELSVAEDGHLTPHQETVQENLDDQIPSTTGVPEAMIQETRFSESLPLKPIQKSQSLSNHTRIKSPRKDYKGLLESFILLKDQKK